MSIDQHIGARVKSARKRLGISQAELARRVGIDQPSISRLEKGERQLSANQLARIAAALNTTVADLMPSTSGSDAVDGSHSPAVQAVLSNYDAPQGLRDLVTDKSLMSALAISDEEVRILSAIPVDGVSRDGYVQLLITLRAVRP
jgi:transcriptional regulator with XRE-family HTH domain